MTHQNHLSIRKMVACSPSQATASNRHSVSKFCCKLEVISRNENFANGIHVWNVNETGLMTVQNPQTVFEGKGVYQANQATSAEKGTPVITCCFISATGNKIPPTVVSTSSP
jgi:hypothetical protein